ncbi:MAG TPA: hypothetical protein PLJ84_04675 [Bacteroidales bacterium]|nr:hypothetical protein [Bacteroidales bacterium]
MKSGLLACRLSHNLAQAGKAAILRTASQGRQAVGALNPEYRDSLFVISN